MNVRAMPAIPFSTLLIHFNMEEKSFIASPCLRIVPGLAKAEDVFVKLDQGVLFLKMTVYNHGDYYTLNRSCVKAIFISPETFHYPEIYFHTPTTPVGSRHLGLP
jgi:hypothetical protein